MKPWLGVSCVLVFLAADPHRAWSQDAGSSSLDDLQRQITEAKAKETARAGDRARRRSPARDRATAQGGSAANSAARVQAADAFLRHRYGFGFGDSPARVRSSNSSGIGLTYDPNWQVLPGCSSLLYVAELSSKDFRQLTQVLSSQDDRCSQAEKDRFTDTIESVRQLISDLGIPVAVSGIGSVVYGDSHDPCMLSIEIDPIQTWFPISYKMSISYRPSPQCRPKLH